MELWDGVDTPETEGNPLLRVRATRKTAEESYNGWTNWETWSVVVQFDNDPFLYSETAGVTDPGFLEAVWNTFDEYGESGVDSSKVNWQEIANSRGDGYTASRRSVLASDEDDWNPDDEIPDEELGEPHAVNGGGGYEYTVYDLIWTEGSPTVTFVLDEVKGLGVELPADDPVARGIWGDLANYNKALVNVPSEDVRKIGHIPRELWGKRSRLKVHSAAGDAWSYTVRATNGDVVESEQTFASWEDAASAARIAVDGHWFGDGAQVTLSKTDGLGNRTDFAYDTYTRALTELKYAARRKAADDKPTEGVTRCACGAKYWDGDKCASCGEKYRKQSRRRRVAGWMVEIPSGLSEKWAWPSGPYSTEEEAQRVADRLRSRMPNTEIIVRKEGGRRKVAGGGFTDDKPSFAYENVYYGLREYVWPEGQEPSMGTAVGHVQDNGGGELTWMAITPDGQQVTGVASTYAEGERKVRDAASGVAIGRSARRKVAAPQDKLPGMEEYGPPTLDEMIDRLPNSVSLVYVDYRDQLSEEQLVQLFDTGDWSAIDDFEADQMWDNAQRVMEEYFDEDELDALTPDEQEELRYAIQERNDSDALGDLARNTPAIGMRYYTGVTFTLTGNESDEETEEVFDEIAKTLGISRSSNQGALEELVYNSSGYNCGLYVAWDEPAEGVIKMGHTPPSRLSWQSPTVLLLDTNNGSGWETTVSGNVSQPFDKSRIRFDFRGAPGGYSWADVIGQTGTFGETRTAARRKRAAYGQDTFPGMEDMGASPPPVPDTTPRTVKFSGTIVRMPEDPEDDSGNNYVTEDGWLQSGYPGMVFDSNPTVYVWEPDSGESAGEWLAEMVSSEVGPVDSVEPDVNGATFYGADAQTLSYQTGDWMTTAAHAEGFTDDEIDEAVRILGVR